MLEGFKSRTKDEFLSNFSTQRGVLRAAYTQARKEIIINQKSTELLKKYGESISTLDTELVMKSFIDYSFAIDQELRTGFGVLHAALRLYHKLILDFKKLVAEIQRGEQQLTYTENDARRTTSRTTTPDGKTADIVMSQEHDVQEKIYHVMLTQVDKDLDLIGSSLEKFIADIAAIDHISLQLALNETQSAIRQVMQEIKNEIITAKKLKKDRNDLFKEDNAIEEEIKADYKKIVSGKMNDAEKRTKELESAGEAANKDEVALNTDLTATLTQLNKLASDTLAILSNKIFAQYVEIRTGEKVTVDRFSKDNLSKAKTNPPSLNVLVRPYQQGGFGFPKDNHYKGMELRAAGVANNYTAELKILISEARVFDADSIRAKGK